MNKPASRANDCQEIWSVFEQAFLGKNPCNVSTDAYVSLINTVTQDPVCNTMLFWSKTWHIVHEFTKKRNCFQTLEDTLLGYIMDGLTWCGKEGSNETFTTGCPLWNDCDNHAVKSFWYLASAAFAEDACGDVSAMLNGSIATPFTPSSVFASIEVNKFNPNKMKSLTVVLVTSEDDSTSCDDPSLKTLQAELHSELKYNCTLVTMSHIQECISDPDAACGPCW
ncbi:hypothetical protein DPEC_G00071200 [Dallia pectoralis]|uniref:Uncharacterized protein n=1 Tax=Dallia pectoralis TaxID=75939 RepID=A0ACC2H3F4_DALPE|nr:hypothetical protein DPEC_G00071200 [Dallia pectoralis]